MNLEVLRAGGVDVDAALARMMGSEALLGRLLGKFTADQSLRGSRRPLPPTTRRRAWMRRTRSRA